MKDAKAKYLMIDAKELKKQNIKNNKDYILNY